jgi:serine/threonine protein phosphatase 1
MHWLRRVLRPHPAPETPPLPRLDGPVCIVGDIHGRADLLDRMLTLIPALPAGRLIFAGDYVDRGPESAQVLIRLRDLSLSGRVICLMGNHERMLLDAIDRPAAAGKRWLLNGGDATLTSLGINGRLPGENEAERMAALAARIRAGLPEGAENWLRTLPLWWRDQGLAVVHAGADPAMPIEDQAEASLLWGHRRFGQPRADGLWIAHGHVVVAEPKAEAGRIAVDTGAWTTGRLTAAWIEAGQVRFITT